MTSTTDTPPSLLLMKSCCGRYCTAVLTALLVTLLIVYRVFRAFPSSCKSGKRNFASCSSRKSGADILLSTDADYLAFSNKLLKTIPEGEKSPTSYEGQARIISQLLKSKVIDVDNLKRSAAQNLFLLHREDGGPSLEGGLGVRMTVQLNLFGGSVANLGSPLHLSWLRQVFERGELGCFALTEASAGVLSGLVVNTTATFRKDGEQEGEGGRGPHFELHTPREADRKTWISQGLTAKWGVVIARLLLPDGDKTVDKGPHAFVIDLTLKGVRRTDMTRKTDFNGLDNAELHFDHVRLELSALLSGISSVGPDGAYSLVDPQVPFKFVSVAQRLLSGRICIAGAAVAALKRTASKVRDYSLTRNIPTAANGKTTPLADLPCMKDLQDELDASMLVFRHFTRANEESFMQDKDISEKLVDRIASGKIEIVGYCIDAINRLKIRVGSFALQEGSPFGTAPDILYVYRFAEGDSTILQNKMARDSLKRVSSLPGIVRESLSLFSSALLDRNGIGKVRVALGVERLRLAITMLLKGSKEAQMEEWFLAHGRIERIAKLHAMITIYDTVCGREGLKGSRELELFRRVHLDSLVE